MATPSRGQATKPLRMGSLGVVSNRDWGQRAGRYNTVMPLERITVFCFGASYATALILELAHLLWPRRLVRLIGLAFGAAGLLAQTIYLACHPPALSSQSGSLLFLAWVL